MLIMKLTGPWGDPITGVVFNASYWYNTELDGSKFDFFWLLGIFFAWVLLFNNTVIVICY